jgi:hypothetical protein
LNPQSNFLLWSWMHFEMRLSSYICDFVEERAKFQSVRETLEAKAALHRMLG